MPNNTDIAWCTDRIGFRRLKEPKAAPQEKVKTFLKRGKAGKEKGLENNWERTGAQLRIIYSKLKG